MPEEKRSVFWTNFFEKRESLEKLIEQSRADMDFYLLLSISAFITSLGLLADNSVIVIGGMLVAPLLFPILSLSMGITTSNKDSIMRSLRTIVKAVILVLLISSLSGFLLREESLDQEIFSRTVPTLHFFLVAFAAGVAAAYTWVKQNLSVTLPGIAIAVALIPPLSAVGIGVNYLDADLIGGALMLFLLNILGIVVSALLMFSLFGFSGMQQVEKKLIEKEEIERLENTKAELNSAVEKLEKVTEQIEEKKDGKNSE